MHKHVCALFSMFSTSALFLCSAVLTDVSAEVEAEHPLVKLMKVMPEVVIADPKDASVIPKTRLIMPGLRVEAQKRIYLDASVLFSQGPQDGLEGIACMRGGKNHESLLLLDCANGELIKSMFIAHLDLLHDGVPAREESGVPARGYPVRVLLRWRPDPVLNPKAWVERDVSTMVRDRSSKKIIPPLPYIYVGSRFQVVQEQKKFMLNVTKTLVTNYDEADTLLASPHPLAMFDFLFEANSADMPQEDTRAQLVFERAVLPLTLQMNAAGAISFRDKIMNDKMLQKVLLEHYGPAYEGLRAVAVKVEAQSSRAFDVQARERILRQAIAAKVWVTPIFVPKDVETGVTTQE